MSTTKPTRRPRPTPTANRQAPTYRRLSDQTYAELDELEKRRHDLHLDIDALIDAVPYATLDRDSIGFPAVASGAVGGGGSGGGDCGKLNGVEAASQHRLVDVAVSWLAEWTECRALIARVANLGRLHYGFDPTRGRDEPGRPTRRPTVDVCAWCEQPAPEGRDQHGRSLNRRIDGRITIHAHPCYDTAAQQAHRLGVSVGAHLANRLSDASNRVSAGHPLNRHACGV